MAKRRESVLDVVLVLPWWGSAIAAVVLYALLMFAVPAYFDGREFDAGVAAAARAAAPYVASAFIALGLMSWLRAVFIKQQFHSLDELEDLRGLSSVQLESLVGEGYRRRGYAMVGYTLGRTHAKGDLVLLKDGDKFHVRCKHWKQRKVDIKPIRELFDAIIASDAVGGIFITAGTFTQQAHEFAAQSSIQLIDGEALAVMVEEARTPQPFMDPTIRAREPTVFGSR